MRRMLLALIFAGLLSGNCYASENFNAAYNQSYNSVNQLPSAQVKNTTALKEGVITVPAGETFRCVFMAPISTETAHTGQEVTLALERDFFYNNSLIAPAGSTVSGTVIDTSKAKHGSLNGKLTMRFTHILTPGGYDIPISALIKTPDGTGTLLGGKDIGLITSEIPASAESVGSVDYTPPYMGMRPGTNAAMATAVETGGGGLLKSIWDKGDDVEISVNSRIDLILTQPISIIPLGL